MQRTYERWWSYGLLVLAVTACDSGDSDSAATSEASSTVADDTGAEPECTLTWTGDATGTAPCTGSDAALLLGIQTADNLNWLVVGETAQDKVSFDFTLADPPSAMTYDGTETDDQFCTASVTKADFTGVWTGSSRPLSSGASLGSCSITFTSVTDDSSNTTSRYIVHGTATATLGRESDAAAKVELSVVF